MKVVMICAPYSSVNKSLRGDITKSVEAASMLLWENGIACITPHLNTGNFADHHDSDLTVYHDGYKEIAKRVDAILSFLPSRKALNQINEVKACKGPTFFDVKNCLRWAVNGDEE